MKKTRKNLPFWAKVLFETPELVTEIMIAFRNTKPLIQKNIHERSRGLAWIDELENGSFDEAVSDEKGRG